MSESNSDFSGILQKILSDPEAMQKILKLAGNLKNDPDNAGFPNNAGGLGDTPDMNTHAGAAETASRHNIPQEDGEGHGKPPKRESGEAEENRIKLLYALKPYLNENRRERADIMIRILKLLRFTDLNELTKLLGGISK